MMSSLSGSDSTRALGRPVRRALSLLTLGLLATACTTPAIQKVASGEIPLVLGPPVRDNVTPMEGVLACFADHLASVGDRPVVIGVGDVKDYTGKY